MICEKVKFTKLEAQIKLNQHNKSGNFKHGYGRIYCCPKCDNKYWHLTSKVKYIPKIKFDDYKEMENNPIENNYNYNLNYKKNWKQLINKK
jgi:hypothetical protein